MLRTKLMPAIEATEVGLDIDPYAILMCEVICSGNEDDLENEALEGLILEKKFEEKIFAQRRFRKYKFSK